MRPNLLNPLGPKLRLASRSPRRAELLTLVGAHFEVAPVELDESALPGERPDAHVLRLAEAKARASRAARDAAGAGRAAEAGPAGDGAEGTVYVGADTVVVIDRAILGKPADRADAARMLGLLSGRVHEVWTGLFILDPAEERGLGEAVRSIVKFSRIGAAEIERYVATGEPLDKAGAYAVQGGGALFVEAIEGSYSNVVGLPLSHLKHLLGLLREAPVREP
ncbi:MAG TPA: Maf family protein [Candidatus Omnitrophota bacterium]|jgi:septum formation protein|nr:Maf family protein [Candidatus Omnitrophota bacterium]